ncbi:MAG: hypothetical protein HY763_01990 [Planctomycetes bacterium]|nr:hypothetical protein [Planctomycetota bacterium]
MKSTDTFKPQQAVLIPTIDAQPCTHGDLTCAVTRLDRTGALHIALAHAADILESTNVPGSASVSLDDFDIPRLLSDLANGTTAALREHSGIDASTASPSLFQDMTRLPSLAAAVERACENVLAERLARLRTQLVERVTAGSGALRAASDSIRMTLQSTRPSTVGVARRAEFQRRRAQQERLAGRRADLKLGTLQRLGTRLLEECRRRFPAAIEEHAVEWLQQRWSRFAGEVNEAIGAAQEQDLECKRAVDEIYAGLHRFLETELQRNRLQEGKLAAVLRDAPQAQLEAALDRKLRTTERADRCVRLRDMLIEQVQKEAGIPFEGGRQVPLRPQLRLVPAAHWARALVGCLESLLAFESSIYERIECYAGGAAQLVADLLRLSELPDRFGGRAIPRFGIAPMRLTIVRLPDPVGPRDQATHDLLKRLFRERDAGVQILSAGTQSAVTVIRTTAGWPLGLDVGSRATAVAYRAAASGRHRAHLVGVVPDSFGGAASPSVVRFLESAMNPRPTFQPQTIGDCSDDRIQKDPE